MARMWIFVLFIVLAAGALALQIHRIRQARKNLAALASRLGWDGARAAPPPIPGAAASGRPAAAMPWAQAALRDTALEGVAQGRAVRFWEYSTGSGKSRSNWAAVKVDLPAPSDLRFHLRRQGLGTALRQMFGAREIVLGDPAFDKAWFIESNQPEFFAAALVPEMRATLLAAAGAGLAGVVECDGSAVKYCEAGSFSSETKVRRLEQLLPALLDLAVTAEVFAQARPSGPPPRPPALS